jgi:hypothetical protein
MPLTITAFVRRAVICVLFKSIAVVLIVITNYPKTENVFILKLLGNEDDKHILENMRLYDLEAPKYYLSVFVRSIIHNLSLCV